MSDLSRASKAQLLAMIESQKKIIESLEVSVVSLNSTITLLNESLDRYRSGIHIKGWWCNCDIFNGEEKEEHPTCRKCHAPKPG